MTTYTFTPPTATTQPRQSFYENANAAPTQMVNPIGYRLFGYFPRGVTGLNVYQMSDGSFMITSQPDVPLTITPGVLALGTPYPDTIPSLIPNDCISSSWYNGVNTVQPLSTPYATTVFLGGHSYTITAIQYAQLLAAGFGAYLT